MDPNQSFPVLLAEIRPSFGALKSIGCQYRSIIRIHGTHEPGPVTKKKKNKTKKRVHREQITFTSRKQERIRRIQDKLK